MLTVYFDADECIIDHSDTQNNKELPVSTERELTEREISRLRDVYAFYNEHYKPQQLVYSNKFFRSFQYLGSITLERVALSADSIWLEELVAGYVYSIEFIQPITTKDLEAVTKDLKVKPEVL